MASISLLVFQILLLLFILRGYIGQQSPASHHCSHGDHDHDHHHRHHHHHEEENLIQSKLPEELAEEEDLNFYSFGSHHDHNHDHDHDHEPQHELSGLSLWLHAMGCSLLVSTASLICLLLLPVIFIHGKPSKVVVDSLALFGAGAMLGDSFLHQLPHAFGDEHSRSHDHHDDHVHHTHAGNGHSHAHSLKDLSVGLSILAGIIFFLLVEKVVRYVEEFSGEANAHSHHHHHHHHSRKKLKVDDDDQSSSGKNSSGSKSGNMLETSAEVADGAGKDSQNGSHLQKRNVHANAKSDQNGVNGCTDDIKTSKLNEPAQSSSNLVFGYLNLFSDGVHNFTDGMALGSAFLLYGSVSGWSRTLFLLAHELPQEIGDFGILVRSGFSASKALFFNFLSALVALAGTALALLWGQDPGKSSLIEVV
ncbi:Zinc/iron permease [Dillenia turbinata]|uniref:Zinc/iron permease n=1 Tax=Dillenia turbinata TaxID=194707 RepID=A0AAN8ZBF7_9MAGN